jgi:hypothetical protein
MNNAKLIAELDLSKTGSEAYCHLYSDGVLEILSPREQQVILFESEWKLLAKILSSIEGSGFGGYNEELGQILQNYANSLLEGQQ